jgi:hypothetical protein
VQIWKHNISACAYRTPCRKIKLTNGSFEAPAANDVSCCAGNTRGSFCRTTTNIALDKRMFHCCNTMPTGAIGVRWGKAGLDDTVSPLRAAFLAFVAFSSSAADFAEGKQVK